jgi:hypothetical protein
MTIERIIVGIISFLYNNIKRLKMLLNSVIDKGFVTSSSNDLDVLEVIDNIIEKYNKGFIIKCSKKQTYMISNRKKALKNISDASRC